jgi:hypothetical protein
MRGRGTFMDISVRYAQSIDVIVITIMRTRS